MSKQKPIKRKIDIVSLVSLIKGDTVIMCGKKGEPDVHLTIDEVPPVSPEEACRQIMDIWGFEE